MPQWRVYVSKIGRSPWTLGVMLVDLILVPMRLRWVGVKFGRGCRFIGQPMTKIAEGSQIILGDHVCLYSRLNSNPAGLSHPTILACLTPESTITIGDRTAMSGASISARKGISIGRNVMIGAGACIWDTDFHPIDPYTRQVHPTRDAACATVSIHDDVFIGARAIILKGVTIGWGAVVGAGAVVTKDVGPCQIAAGNPARIVGSVLSHHECLRESQ